MEDWERELWEQAEAEGTVGRIYRDETTGEIVSEVSAATYMPQPRSAPRPPSRSPMLRWPRRARRARPRERRGTTRRLTRAGPGGDDPSGDPEPSRRCLLRLAALWVACAGLIDIAFSVWWPR